MTDLKRLQILLDSVPGLPASDLAESADHVEESLRFFESNPAREWLDVHPYWPKWHGAWWRLLTLAEMGFASRVPREHAERLAESARDVYHDGFFEREVPHRLGGFHRHRRPCPCQLGNLCLILQSYGVDVDHYLPWARAWFLRYQMEDGGMSCAEKSYEAIPQASSMVGLIAGLEALLGWPDEGRSEGEIRFIERAADHLIRRRLVEASTAPANGDEKLDEADWKQAAFPRFYFYDVQRGLRVLVLYAKKMGHAIPAQALLPAVESLVTRFPNGRVHLERQVFEQVDTWWTAGEWTRGEPEFFPLLDRVSEVGRYSPALTKEWASIRSDLRELFQDGRIEDRKI